MPASAWFVFGAAFFTALAVMARNRLTTGEPKTFSGYSVVEYVAAMIAVVYAVVLGLAVVSVWGSLSDANSHVSSEASGIREIYLLADGFPDQNQAPVRKAAHTYTREVVDREWPMMSKDQRLSPAAWRALDEFRTRLMEVRPVTAGQKAAFEQSLIRMHDVYDARRLRESDVTDGMPLMIWAMLLFGGFATLGISLAIGINKGLRPMAMVGALALLVGFQLDLVYELNQPFSHSVSVSPQPFREALARFDVLS